MRHALSALPFLCLAAAGCAHVEFTHVRDPDDPGDDGRGVRWYEPRPYLRIVAQPGKGGDGPEDAAAYASEIIWLPDHSRPCLAVPRTGWGSAELDIKLADGWRLVEAGGKGDARAPETIGAIASLMAGPLKTFALPREKGALPPQGKLYRIVIGKDGSVGLEDQAGWERAKDRGPGNPGR